MKKATATSQGNNRFTDSLGAAAGAETTLELVGLILVDLIRYERGPRFHQEIPSTIWLTAPYKDRSDGLVVFGILTILLGCLAGLLVLLIVLSMLFGQALSDTAANTQVNFSAILPALFMYGVLAVALGMRVFARPCVNFEESSRRRFQTRMAAAD
jgi:tellurite resistance protein TehA-like permease